MKTQFDYQGYTVKISIHHDENHGVPWEENDGHGIVSEWTSRDKNPGELILCHDRSSYRFYDFEGTMKLAKKDGWGVGDEKLAQLEKNLGRKATRGEITRASVMMDFEFLRGWANDDWHYQGYTTEIETPSAKAEFVRQAVLEKIYGIISQQFDLRKDVPANIAAIYDAKGRKPGNAAGGAN